MKKVSIDEMGNAIQKEFEDYVEMSASKVKTIVKEVADDVKQKIQDNAPVDTGGYKKSWEITQTENSSLGATYTVHAKKYQLTHLLEFGHAKRGGGRVAAKPHIAAAEQAGIESFEQAIERSL